ncbi:hypothetical protein OG2516_11881 [Oceanicola granulosus HTCC2516]|uniref:Thioredoxin domain-containing protein n=1 Tax=Oceanicola granulosus (strain ATCC BAA-861 / DSM 15982 / KCTC 12143 / HTCC2516) TaxID=314256 RepID=Q2CJH7_OCEGH|nr:redoxin domain-containing protein [Oceanicola granulosus]EAR53162.1 hypothetical protein OG2516_11881 [Oceanicola granulosus HTCC2516]
MLMPARKTPPLSLPLVGDGQFDLDRDGGAAGTLVVFYRGLHCPICKKQMSELDGALEQFEEQGVKVVMVSADDADKAEETKRTTGASRIAVAHSLDLEAARDAWGLWISDAREGSEEPALFNEPGVFFILPDRTLYSAHVQSIPFARPSAEDLIGMVKFRAEKQYPPRGDHEGPLHKAA